MGINVSKVLKEEAERKARPAAVPKIKTQANTDQLVSPGIAAEISDKIHRGEIAYWGSDNTYPQQLIDVQAGPSKKELLLAELQQEYSSLYKERAKLSTRSAHLVNEIEAGLRKESLAIANEFMAGNIPMPELAAQYQKIQVITDQLGPLYDRIEHVKMYGELPVNSENISSDDTTSIDALKHQRDRLKDLIHKKRKNIKNKIPQNPSRMAIWKEELARAEAMRDEVVQKIKILQYEARG